MRTPHLARIGYVSALCEHPSSDELEELLSAWRQRNAEHGITGLLLYDAGSVLFCYSHCDEAMAEALVAAFTTGPWRRSIV
jgi:hypothetical protein